MTTELAPRKRHKNEPHECPICEAPLEYEWESDSDDSGRSWINVEIIQPDECKCEIWEIWLDDLRDEIAESICDGSYYESRGY